MSAIPSTAIDHARPGGGFARLATALRFAGRELRGGIRRGLRGFGIFIACLALGVAAIAGVAGLGRSFDASLAERGDAILGGDLAFGLNHRRIGPEERAFLAARGALSEVATLRAMARRPDGDRAMLVEAKAVDAAYPLIGAVTASDGSDGRPRLAAVDGVHGALVEEGVLQRLGVAIGDEIRLGEARIRIAGVIGAEPDRLSSGIGFGPRLLVSQDALDASGLLAPGSLVRWTTRLRLAPGAGEAVAVEAAARAAFPASGWEIRRRDGAAPGMKATIERFVQFLTLVGLTTLVIGGVGVANAVAGHLERRRTTIAIWKALGATAGFVFLVHALEIGAIALVGIGVGLGLGALVPVVLAGPLGAVIGVSFTAVVDPGALALAGLEGLLVAALFVVVPLTVAVATRPAALLRDDPAPEVGRSRRYGVLAAAAIGMALVALVIVTAPERRITLPYVGVLIVALVGLRLVAAAVMAVARRVPRPHGFVWRSALGAIARTGAPTASLVLSLGLGATLVTALVEVEIGLTTAIERTLPGRAPSFFFIDVPARDADPFHAFLEAAATGAKVEDVPMLRGRITALKGVPVERVAVAETARFVLDGDRGVTFASLPPPNSTVVEGAWWPADHAGPPLVSFDAETARGLGLALGDSVRVNVLGREIEARIANLRRIEWDRLAINFFMVFSPDAFRGAPATRLVTVTWPDGGSAAAESALFAGVIERFPTVTAIRVKDALAQVDALVRQSAAGISAVAGFALIAAVLVLAGALSARAETRVRDAAILTALGATRGRLLGALALEFALVALASGVFAAGLGTVAADWVLTRVMRLPFTPDLGAIVAVIVGISVVTIGLGLASTRRALARPAAEVLRSV